MDAESELLMAVYARFGLAMHYVAMIEWDLLMMRAISKTGHGSQLSRGDVDRLIDAPPPIAVDEILTDLKRDVRIPDGMRESLISAFDVRERLATGYFREKALDLLSVEGRVGMMQEMNHACQMLQILHQALDSIASDLSTATNVTRNAAMEEVKQCMCAPRDKGELN